MTRRKATKLLMMLCEGNKTVFSKSLCKETLNRQKMYSVMDSDWQHRGSLSFEQYKNSWAGTAIYIYIYIYIYISVCVSVCMCEYRHIHTHTHYIYIYIYIYTLSLSHTHTHTHTHTYIYIYIYMKIALKVLGWVKIFAIFCYMQLNLYKRNKVLQTMDGAHWTRLYRSSWCADTLWIASRCVWCESHLVERVVVKKMKVELNTVQ